MALRKGRVSHIVSKIEDMNRVSVTAPSVFKSAGEIHNHVHIHLRFYSAFFNKGEIFTFSMLLSSGDADESINENPKYSEDSALIAAFKESVPTPVGNGKG